ncbi:molybdenum cofactor guanylyltransferase [Anseongella ginsenosidimutans]|uniref:Molybdenum cofactor guanylyltransferase n=1 Tax=Anseongella ginsenosidimutans TaxID=496056 RepID=A0A4R3KYP0_9SPHI|nr:NTP transferase domain-containing protein [Anseongella ginsenosidimutans]TCS90166.1 molybdenum cofactor guanylyltransferase [Anseongella ginsenosidimutans]
MVDNHHKPLPRGLNGLILCGGQSRRMQTDKSLLEYRRLPHWQYVQALLEPFVSETWVSCRKEQASQFAGTAGLLFDDDNSGMAGPAAGMLAAHRRFPATGWLVVACDLPLVTAESIQALVKGRDPSLQATAILNPEKEWPEPLLAIWEPSGLQVLEENAGEGRCCPRKTLQQLTSALISCSNPAELFNANTPGERLLAEKELAEKLSGKS